ncbi:tetratricopeptide repeat protein [Halomonas sp.]|uniref:tetratricopeptide repeat protein n=1 Tax=Halomonas sp. TaxID=1486246 RepID=UPI003D0FBCC5
MKLTIKKIVTLTTSVALAGTLALSPLSASETPTIEDTGFSDIYATSFLTQSYSIPIMVTGLAVVAAGGAVFTTMTAGTGAPAALAGVGALASSIGGNVPGAYMIGLSTVGGFFGGNAIVGAAILNGAAAAIIATTGGSVVSASIAGTAYLVDGFNYLKKKETKELAYLTTLKLSTEMGSKSTQDSVTRITKLESEIMSLARDISQKEKELAIATQNLSVLQAGIAKRAINIYTIAYDIRGMLLEQKNRVAQLQSLKTSQVEALERILEGATHRQEDILSLSLIAWNEHRYDLFQRAISKLIPAEVADTSFYHYLRALSAIAEGDLEQADRELSEAMLAGPYALEPVILRAVLLGENFEINEHRLNELAFFAQNHFDIDEYNTNLKLPSLYFRLASIYFQNEQYDKAKGYFKKAHSELGILQRSDLIGRTGLGDQDLSHLILANIANADYMLGNIEDADALIQDITRRMEKKEKAAIMGIYEGSFHE